MGAAADDGCEGEDTGLSEAKFGDGAADDCTGVDGAELGAADADAAIGDSLGFTVEADGDLTVFSFPQIALLILSKIPMSLSCDDCSRAKPLQWIWLRCEEINIGLRIRFRRPKASVIDEVVDDQIPWERRLRRRRRRIFCVSDYHLKLTGNVALI